MKRILVAIVGLCVILSSCNSALPQMQIELDGQSVDFSPRVYESGNYSGSFWDSSAERLPCLDVSNNEYISLHFLEKPPSDASITMYEIYDTSISLGATSAHGDPTSIEFEYQDDRISFDIGEAGEQYRLYVCACNWKELFNSTTRKYIFVTEIAE